MLKIINSNFIILFIAIILIINSTLFLLKIKFTLPFHHNHFSQIVVGSINGVIIGMTSIYTMPLVFLLQSLNYNKNITIQFLGIAFFLYPLGQIISFSNFLKSALALPIKKPSNKGMVDKLSTELSSTEPP